MKTDKKKAADKQQMLPGLEKVELPQPTQEKKPGGSSKSINTEKTNPTNSGSMQRGVSAKQSEDSKLEPATTVPKPLPADRLPEKKDDSTDKRPTPCLSYLIVFIILAVCMVLFVRSVNSSLQKAVGAPAGDLPFATRLITTMKLYSNLGQLTTAAGTQDTSALISVNEGDTPVDVAQRLQDAQIISDAMVFEDYLIYSGEDRLLQLGKFPVNAAMTIPEIGHLLSDSGRSLLVFSFLSGMRLEELAELIDRSGLSFSGTEFLTLAQNYPSEQHPAQGTSLEGYFLPGRYEMERTIQLEPFVQGFVREFNKRVTLEMRNAFAANNLSLNEALTMASMVAKEAMSAEEYPMIASVFYNRIAAGMRFQSDPTVQYAIGLDTASGSWWKNPLTATDMSVYSPYNTYEFDGFPPAPICNPSLSVLEAVAHPAKSDYLYFRVKCDGSPYHEFSETYEEHVAKECK